MFFPLLTNEMELFSSFVFHFNPTCTEWFGPLFSVPGIATEKRVRGSLPLSRSQSVCRAAIWSEWNQTIRDECVTCSLSNGRLAISRPTGPSSGTGYTAFHLDLFAKMHLFMMLRQLPTVAWQAYISITVGRNLRLRIMLYHALVRWASHEQWNGERH